MSRLADIRDERQAFVMSVLLETGALETCEHHEHITMDGGEDVEDACKHAEKLFRTDENSVPFDSINQMNEEIRRVYADHSYNDTCEACADWERD